MTNAPSPFQQGKPLFLVGCLALLIGATVLSPPVQETSRHKVGDQADSRSTVENLRTFARLYGYVRYFHPSDAASRIDWNRFALHGVRQVRSDALQERLEALFEPVAPTVRIYRTDAPPPPAADVLTPADTAGLNLVAWQHRGVDLGNRGPYRSIRLHRATRTQRGTGFGPIAQSVDATPYRGKRVRLRAAVRTEVIGIGSQAQLWLRVDRPEGRQGFFDNMVDRPITGRDWDVYQITGPVAEDAEQIVFGGLLLGRGAAQFDHFQLAVQEPPNEAWTRVSIENAGFEQGEAPASWSAQSPGYAFATEQGDAYEGERSQVIESSETLQMAEHLFETLPEAGEVVNKPLGRDLSAQIPLALYSDSASTLRPETAPSTAPLLSTLEALRVNELSAADEALRFANVIIAWNVFQHFYPYFNVVDVDWDQVLTRTLQRAASDSSGEDFLQTLRWMVAQLDDGHGRVHHPSEETVGLPFRAGWIEDEVVVTAVRDLSETEAEPCMRRGDIVVSAEGTPAEDVLDNAKRYISGSPQWKTYRALTAFGRGAPGAHADLVLERDGRQIECEAPRNPEHANRPWQAQSRPDAIEEVESDIYYVDLTRTDMDTIQGRIDEFAVARGMVFDMRGYPQGGNQRILQHLSQQTLRSARWQVPQFIYPDQEHVASYDTTGRWTMPPLTPSFTGEIGFLTDERAISYAESIMGIVEHYELGEIVGRPTAGANGNINPLSLPGGYRVMWTGMRVVKHDGSPHHIVGIEPTVPVERTIEGVSEGRDEDLEKALDVIRTSGEAGR